MPETGPITIALAGAGATTLDNMTELLNDLLGFGPEKDADGYYTESGREEIFLLLPASATHSNKYLDLAVDWSASVDLPYHVVKSEKDSRKSAKTLEDSSDVVEASDVNQAIIDYLTQSDAAEKMLVLLWGDDEEEQSEELEELLEKALDAGIAVKDLTAGLDDIKFGDDEEPAAAPDPEPEPEPEPAPARRRGRRGAEAQVEEETPLVEETPDLPHDRQTKGTGTPVEHGDTVHIRRDDLETALGVLRFALGYFAAEDATNAAVNMAEEVQYRPLTRAMDEVAGYLSAALGQETPSEATGSPESDEPAPEAAEEPPAAPKRSRGRPRADGSPAQAKDPDEPTITVFEDEDGNLTKAGRGRPPKGQKRTKITEAQAEELGLN